ncbi:MAG: ABC transporter permease [Planctomycetes bacterium]|nr:ABC transporter permease [Planctomycetota bacterium]
MLRRLAPYLQQIGLVVILVAMALTVAGLGGERTVTRSVDGELRTFRVNALFNPEQLLTLATSTSFIAIMAVGATLVIASGGIDLSIGAVYALAASAGALVLKALGPAGAGWSEGTAVAAGVAACLAVGVGAGAVNGCLVVALRVHPFIITLGTMAIFRGIAFLATGGQAVTNFPPLLQHLVKWDLGGGLYPVPLLVMLAVAGLAALYLRRTVPGIYVFAVGGNETAARYSGLPVNKVKISVYTIAGGTGGLAAVLLLGYYGGASSDAGFGYELNVIAAAVIGGASLLGGRGGAVGALLGALLIQLIDTSITILNIDQNYSLVILGFVVIVAVLLDQSIAALARRLALAPAEAQGAALTPGGNP